MKADTKLSQLIVTQQGVYNRQFLLDILIQNIDYIGSILAYFLLAMAIFGGRFDDVTDSLTLSTVISENVSNVMYLIGKLTKLVDLAVKVSVLGATCHRIGELIESLNKIPASNKIINEKKDEKDENLVLKVKDVTLFTPDSQSRLLVKNLSFKLESGESLVIMGKSSAGKSSLFRALKGMWPLENGSMKKSPDMTGMYIPQKSFLSNGSIVDLIAYPKLKHQVELNQEWLMKELKLLELEGLVNQAGGLHNDPCWNWEDYLSPGEIQRLSFIRLFFHQPQIAFLDESTSALSMDVEKMVYERCKASGMTLISIAHRESCMRYHSHVLNIGLDNQGSWNLSQINNTK